MATRSGYPQHIAKPYPHKKKHRRKRKSRYLKAVVIFLPVFALVLAVGLFCAKALPIVYRGMKDAFAFVAPVAPPASAPEVTQTESTFADREAPILMGIHDFTVYQGDSISYLSGITATDDYDAAPAIAVDNTAVDLSKAGEYRVLYTATDRAGNVSRSYATVTVLQKEEGFVDLDTIYAEADAKLVQIIRENATVTQQVHDIYTWARCNLSYGGHSDRTDWRQSAYAMLTDGRGDCYGYFAVTKLLFERLEIPNIDVRKVKNSSKDSDHFWSLVSTDGGETWYHFDATPRHGTGDDFCLVTDAFLDAYSDSHKGSHNRDKSLYPATP